MKNVDGGVRGGMGGMEREQGSEIKNEYVKVAMQRIDLLKKGKLPIREIFTPIQMLSPNSKLYKRS